MSLGYYSPFQQKQKKSCILCKCGYTLSSGAPPLIYRPKSVFTTVFTKTLQTFVLIWHLFYVFVLLYSFGAKKKEKSYSPTTYYHQKLVFTIVFTKTLHTFLLIWHLFFFWGGGYYTPFQQNQKKSLTSSLNWGIPSYWSPTPYISS